VLAINLGVSSVALHSALRALVEREQAMNDSKGKNSASKGLQRPQEAGSPAGPDLEVRTLVVRPGPSRYRFGDIDDLLSLAWFVTLSQPTIALPNQSGRALAGLATSSL